MAIPPSSSHGLPENILSTSSPVAILIAGLHTGGEIAEITHKIPKATVDVLQGIILLLILLSGTIKKHPPENRVQKDAQR